VKCKHWHPYGVKSEQKRSMFHWTQDAISRSSYESRDSL